MFEEDHIYISSGEFSVGLTVPNWPVCDLQPLRSLVVRGVEPGFLAEGFQVERNAARPL